MIQAVLFDLDGTLADTLDDIAAALNHGLAAHGCPTRSRDVVRQLVGEGAARLIERAVPSQSPELRAPVLETFRSFYADNALDRTLPYPGIPGLIARLRAAGLTLAVLSNKPDGPTRRVVDGLFPDRPFAAVQGERAGVPRKPDPFAALAIAKALGVAPGRCAFVGDTAVDMGTARAAGMRPLGVLWGFRDAAELREGGAELLARTAAELENALLGGLP